MAFAVFDLLTAFLFEIWGHPYLIALVLFSVMILMMMALRANVAVILGIMIPVAVGLVLNTAYSNFIEIPAWILIIMFVMAGAMFSLIFLFFSK